jgi:hypothetical protein
MSFPGWSDLLGDALGHRTADQVTFGLELGGERGVADETEDLELAVGTVTVFDHAPAVPVELARAYDPNDGGAIPQGLPLGLVLAVLVPQRRIHLVDQCRAVGIGDSVVELGQEDEAGAGPVDQLGDGRDEVVPAS